MIFDDADVEAMLSLVRRQPMQLMLIQACRRYAAAVRWSRRSRLDISAETSESVMPGTVTHNRQETENGLFGSSRRTGRLLGPLSSLEPVYSNAKNLRVLSIGPRTEMELMHLMGLGFRAENIKAIDLISSSDMIGVGDMHALPYSDATFDVVISGWVLTYSSTPGVAIKEMVRVCKLGGLIAIGTTYAPEYGEDYVAGTKADPENIVGCMFRHTSEFIDHIGLCTPMFMSQPDSDNTKGAVMLIARLPSACMV